MVVQLIMENKVIVKKATNRVAMALSVAPEYREVEWIVLGFMILRPTVRQTRTSAVSSTNPALIVVGIVANCPDFTKRSLQALRRRSPASLSICANVSARR
jgi:hypothetical protein